MGRGYGPALPGFSETVWMDECQFQSRRSKLKRNAELKVKTLFFFIKQLGRAVL